MKKKGVRQLQGKLLAFVFAFNVLINKTQLFESPRQPVKRIGNVIYNAKPPKAVEKQTVLILGIIIFFLKKICLVLRVPTYINIYVLTQYLQCLALFFSFPRQLASFHLCNALYTVYINQLPMPYGLDKKYFADNFVNNRIWYTAMFIYSYDEMNLC